jgi:hypothetical protein
MNTEQMQQHRTQEQVGARPRDEVERAHDALAAVAAGPTGQTQPSRGALAAYLWALGRGTATPVTGAASPGTPGPADLAAELEAAAVQLEDPARRNVPRDYTRGVHDALAWICGRADRHP